MLKNKLFGMLTLIFGLSLFFAIMGCGSGDNGGILPPTPQSVTFISQDSDGNRYTLVITENLNRATRFVARDGDSFTFSVELFNNGTHSVALTYSGIIDSSESSGTELEINITVNGSPLSITINGTEMTVIEGTIVLDNEELLIVDEPLTPSVPPAESPTVPPNNDQPNANGSVVYIVGGYITADGIPRAGYWHNSTWHSLPVPSGAVWSSAHAIAVSGSDVYILGSYTFDHETEVVGYWRNGVWNSLSIPAGAEGALVSDIAISGNNVYIGGTLVVTSDPYRFRAGYWLNGTWHNLPENFGVGSSVRSVAVNGNNVVFGGENGDYAVYWLNGSPTGYQDGYPSVTGIAITDDGRIHTIFNDYFIDGVRQNLPSFDYASSITASGNNVYVVGVTTNGQLSYWRNGVRNNLTSPATDTHVRSITVIGGNLHGAGSRVDGYSDVIHNNIMSAYYWFNNSWQNLPAPSGALSSFVGTGMGWGQTIAIVE